MKVGKIKEDNLASAYRLCTEASEKGVNLIVLPECFNSPYGTKYFKKYSESDEGDTVKSLSKWARELGVYLVGGSIPEASDDKFYNTCYAFDRKGNIIAKHRKIHLFDINIPNKIRFFESDVLTAGESPTILQTEYGNIGLGICYDMRFSELAYYYSKNECFLVLYPGAFNTTTGPLHWSLLQRARAVDNQLYVAACAPARVSGEYESYGHSSVVDPWGNVMTEAGIDEEIIYADISI